MRKKVYSIWFLVIALIVGAWSVPSARNTAFAAQSNLDATSACDHASTQLVGSQAQLPKIKGLIHDICEFRVRLNQINNKPSEFDRLFIENAIASNMLEIQSLQIALNAATDPEWRGMIQMMITMHTSDLQMAMDVAKKIGANTKPDLTNVRVYPGTPDYDLGIRRENLAAKFLDPLKSAAGTPGGGTATPPVDMTASPTGASGTETATGVPMDTATGAPTGMSALAATNTPTGAVIFDDTDPAWTYTGTWTTFNGAGPYNNTLHQSNTAGSYAEVTFTGRQITLIYLQGGGRGSIDVYIDGTLVDTVNANSTTLVWQATWTSGTLSTGGHTVRFQNASGGWIDLDALMVSSSATPTTMTPTNTPIVVPTDTATLAPTDTATLVPTDTPTLVPTDTATMVPTDTATLVPTETGTAVPTGTSTAVPTGTGTEVPTIVPTGTPSGGGTGATFDLLSLELIRDEHIMDVQTALAAERLTKNDEIRAFAKHLADVAQLHLMLMDQLQHRLAFNVMSPLPSLDQDYQSPRRFEPR